MATRKAKKSDKEGILIQTLDIKQVNRTSVDIKKWRDALKAAEGQNENRKAIYEMYAEVILDGHLISLINKRIMSITNSDIQFLKDGKEVEGIDELLKSKEFKKILKRIIEAKIYGHSLVEFTPNDTELGFTTKLIDRRHVKPKFGIVVTNPSDTAGEQYREPPYSDFTLEVGEPDDFGLLLQASQYVIYKRGGFGDWADYIQRYGVPMLHGKYKNEETRKTLFDVLSNMGSSGVAVTPEDALIEILRAEGATGANLVFSNFKQACNDEMSITLLGQTMTTSDSGNAGFAQGKVHKDVEDGIHLDDKLDTLSILNSDVIPILANLGLQVEGGEFSYPDIDSTTLKERIEIDSKLANIIPMGKQYFYDKYGIPVPDKADTIGEASTTLSPNGDKKDKKKDDKKEKKDEKLTDIEDANIVRENFISRFMDRLFS